MIQFKSIAGGKMVLRISAYDDEFPAIISRKRNPEQNQYSFFFFFLNFFLGAGGFEPGPLG